MEAGLSQWTKKSIIFPKHNNFILFCAKEKKISYASSAGLVYYTLYVVEEKNLFWK